MTKGMGVFLGTAVTVVIFFCVSIVGAVTGGNDFYRVAVEGSPAGVGIGVYTVATGPSHPITGGLGTQNVLFGGGIPGTSFTSIRSYTSHTDYTQRSGLTLGAGAPLTVPLDSFVAAGDEAIAIGSALNPSGFTTIYRPGTTRPAPDSLTITQEASVVGATFNTSAFQLRTSIRNDGASPVQVGLRYLWDFQIGSDDDGPSFRQKGPDGPAVPFETNALSPGFDSFEIQDDNDPSICFGVGNSPFPFFAVRGSVAGPSLLAPTAPTRLTYLSWPQASGLAGKLGGTTPALNAFDYLTIGGDVGTCIVSVDDTGVAYWWGDRPGNAITIAPGATVSVAAYIFAYLPGTPPIFPSPIGPEGPPGNPNCTDGIDNDGDGLVDILDPDCVAAPPGHEGPACDATCSDGIDNDGDGLTDGSDPDCVPSPGVEGPSTDPTCHDGKDNDGDCLVDSQDPDCAPPPNSPPDCGAAGPSEGNLWPPNHTLRTIRIGGVTDADGDPIKITVNAVRQDEPLNALGDGNTCPDAGSVGGNAAFLRVERSGTGDGRVYHIDFTADDGRGGQCAGVVPVCVPHDQGRRKACVDQGLLFDSTGPCLGKPRTGQGGH